MRKQLSRSYSFIYKTTHRQIPASGSSGINKSSTFLSGYCTPQEGYIEPFIPAASCGVFWKVLDKYLSLLRSGNKSNIFYDPDLQASQKQGKKRAAAAELYSNNSTLFQGTGIANQDKFIIAVFGLAAAISVRRGEIQALRTAFHGAQPAISFHKKLLQTRGCVLRIGRVQRLPAQAGKIKFAVMECQSGRRPGFTGAGMDKRLGHAGALFIAADQRPAV